MLLVIGVPFAIISFGSRRLNERNLKFLLLQVWLWVPHLVIFTCSRSCSFLTYQLTEVISASSFDNRVGTVYSGVIYYANY